MKKSTLILFFLASFLGLQKVQAQANVQATGISIQGIARDENNSAIANIDQLGLAFKIYYLDGSNNEVTILNQTANVKTDNFGVFSYVMSIDKSLFTSISNSQAYLKVTQGSVVFSNEKLQAVPYAIQAQNGVPTGTIMAYIGATAPEGWLLCDGSSFPDNVYYAQLKALLGGTNTPNLSARYLRGTGIQEGRGGITLKGTQYDELRQHAHGVNLTTTVAGSHAHETLFSNDDYNLSGTEVEINNDGKKMISVAGTGWYTNIDHGRRHLPITLMTMEDNIKFSKHKEVKGKQYQKYDNYDAIEIPFTDAIPSNYKGIMGVPISFLTKHCPEQFEIIGATESEGRGFSEGLWDEKSKVSQPLINNERVYKRIFIKHKKPVK
jgi:microcystin-dependent protein